MVAMPREEVEEVEPDEIDEEGLEEGEAKDQDGEENA
jgi:hypothetical protein